MLGKRVSDAKTTESSPGEPSKSFPLSSRPLLDRCTATLHLNLSNSKRISFPALIRSFPNKLLEVVYLIWTKSKAWWLGTRRLQALSRSAETRVEHRSQTPTWGRGIEVLFTASDHQLIASSTLICFIRVCNSEI
ncbi:hypothetical protein M407DRAFT_25871 [Tulasnella calospora MUT 4182]|uniref:Uncharacterized protein n=1 Tax=Tulasnella calospora MUT 4182 TaxID=1051891 RepID=A0A0C3QF85_9AGAM|nr:hypothetical protein M407DRAFT_25871 [Tulasnella calospora MUT 4182]